MGTYGLPTWLLNLPGLCRPTGQSCFSLMHYLGSTSPDLGFWSLYSYPYPYISVQLPNLCGQLWTCVVAGSTGYLKLLIWKSWWGMKKEKLEKCSVLSYILKMKLPISIPVKFSKFLNLWWQLGKIKILYIKNEIPNLVLPRFDSVRSRFRSGPEPKNWFSVQEPDPFGRFQTVPATLTCIHSHLINFSTPTELGMLIRLFLYILQILILTSVGWTWNCQSCTTQTVSSIYLVTTTLSFNAAHLHRLSPPFYAQLRGSMMTVDSSCLQ